MQQQQQCNSHTERVAHTMSHKHSKAGDKVESYWSSIQKEKLDTLKWVLLHSGINTAKLQNDDGMTGLQVAAMDDRAKAMLVMLDIMRQQRVIGEAIDVPDEHGLTPLMLAARVGSSRCVDHLLYYGASQTARSAEGLTAREYAVRAKKAAVLEVFEEANDTGKGAGEVETAVDADGLTSTQRNKLKKKQMKEGERNTVLAAVTAAANAMSLTEEGGASDAPAADAATPAPAAAVIAIDSFGRSPLPATMPRPVWPEIATALEEKRREMTIDRVTTVKKPGDESAAAATAAAATPTSALGDEIDPSLWHCTLLNRLELRLSPRESLSPLVGHLVHLQTLILSGLGLSSLPETLVACSELKFLDVARNALESLPSALGRLPKLEVLDLRDNKLTSLAALSGCTALLTLQADRNAIEDLPLNFAALPRLETLSLSANKLVALPEEVRGMR